jgi:hypothetical protein
LSRRRVGGVSSDLLTYPSKPRKSEVFCHNNAPKTMLVSALALLALSASVFSMYLQRKQPSGGPPNG